MNWLEIQFWKFAIWLIKRGYGADCETSDLDDFPDDHTTAKSVFDEGRCASCRAREMIDWIEQHINP